ncbi:putative membrane protein YccC [Phyllobacterium trifolii]|uniref:Putative membrane protein YccC n=1 Tax=Phyllobacterium trifolii TaxID=300193 RepID=A0A839ULF6_9HYPH|nr:FUSC family protein [Phyllobacterium trifolii]MBB3149542.1 putative membrane protein YccC [Phyllobacterium trifolii]
MRIPVHIWAYALRTWLAAVIALYAAFWLQLGGASSAAVTVAILALPTRGAALSKAAHRLAATFIGATMSIVIAGFFPGEPLGLLLSFICWMCICVFAASYLRGYRAYAAVLSGYTVGIITVANIDTPQNVFTTMTDRVAAITIGILCVTIINDVFGSPPVWSGLDRKISDIWRDVREYARGVLSKGEDNPETAGALLSQIAGLREDIDVVGHDMADGRHRAAGARSAMMALLEMVYVLRRLSLSKCEDPIAVSVRAQCLAALDDEELEASTLLSRLRESELSRQNIVVGAVAQVQQAIRFVESKGLYDDGMWSLREGRPPARDVRLRDTKAFFFAGRNAFRVGVALSACAIFLVLAGWPASVAALTITAILCALSTTAQSPSKLAIGAIVAFPIAAASAGFVQFYILTESQDFVRLAIAVAPILIFGCLLSVRPQIAGIGTIMNVLFLVLLAPSNPQPYNPLNFFFECIFVAFALCVVLLATRLVWPVSDLDRQLAAVRATKRTLAASVSGDEESLPALGFALAARVADYVGATAPGRGSRPHVLRALLATNDLSLAAASAHLHLNQTSDDPAIRSGIGALQRVLQSGNSRRLYAAARSILRRTGGRQAASHEPLIAAATDLWATGLVLEDERLLIRHFCDYNLGDGLWRV